MHPHAIAIWKKAGLALLLALGLGLIVSAAARQVVTVGPVTIGDHVAGSFADATGHSAQSHLVYAVNSRTWWLFTLTSTGDAQGGSNHVVKAFRSSGPDLATATWIAAADSPPAVAASTTLTMSTVARTAPPTSLFFHIAHPFVRHTELTAVR